MNLELLRKILNEKYGISTIDLDDQELLEMIEKLNLKNKINLDIENDRQSLDLKTYIDLPSIVTESLDNSDLDNIIDQIQDALKDRK